MAVLQAFSSLLLALQLFSTYVVGLLPILVQVPCLMACYSMFCLQLAVTQQRCTAVHLPMCTEYCRCRVVDNVLHAWHVVLLGLL
jgi:hypothetical protein